MKYLRIFRFFDQYPFFGAALGAALYTDTRGYWIVWWAIGASLVSSIGFVVNELVDRRDVDRGSWNPVHIGPKERFTPMLLLGCVSVVLVAGLTIAWRLGLFWWAIAILVLWLCYSLPPIRWKGVVVLDLLTQLAVMFIIPYVAVVWHSGTMNGAVTALLVFAISLFLVPGYFLYQLADFEEDRRAGLASTHIILGMKGSIVLGIGLALLSFVVFFAYRIGSIIPWLWLLVPLQGVTLVYYISVWRLRTVAVQCKNMQQYVRIVKPLSQVVIPLLLLWWLSLTPR